MRVFRFRLRFLSDLRFFLAAEDVSADEAPRRTRETQGRCFLTTPVHKHLPQQEMRESQDHLKPLMAALVVFVPHGTMRIFLPGPVYFSV